MAKGLGIVSGKKAPAKSFLKHPITKAPTAAAGKPKRVTTIGEVKSPIKSKNPITSKILTIIIPKNNRGIASVRNHLVRIHNFLDKAFSDGLR